MRPKSRRYCPLTVENLEDRITPTISFGSPDTYMNIGSNALCVTAGDLTGNGEEDLVAATYTNGIYVFMNNGNGTFTDSENIPISTIGEAPTSMALADMTGNGKLDLVVSSSYPYSQNLIIYLGNGNGTFQTQNPIVESLAYTADDMAVADLNGDGLPDVVIGSYGGAVVYLNNGTSSILGTPAYYNIGSNPYYNTCITVGDFGGNGKPDIVVTNGADNQFDIYPNNGNGTFGTPTPYSDPTSESFATGDLTVGDFTNNGKLDLVAGYAGTSNVGLYLGNGNGTFQSPIVINTEAGVYNGPSPLAVADLDNDGNLDLVVGNQGPNTVLPGNGNGTFRTPIQVNSTGGASDLILANLTGDGLPDMITTGNGSPGSVTVNLNDSNDSNLASFAVSAKSPVTAGQPVTVTVTAENGAGETMSDYTGSVVFSSSDNNAQFPSNTQFQASDDGVATFQVTLETAGSQSIDVADSVNSSASGGKNVTVDPGSVDPLNSTFELDNLTDQSGSADQATVVLVDDYGNPETGLSSDFNFSQSGGTSTGSYEDLSETTPGTYTANFIGDIAGTASNQILTVNGIQLNDEPTVTVTPGPIDADKTTAAFTTSNVASGSTDTVTIAVKDAAGNPIANLAGNLFDLSLSGGSSTGTFEAVTQSSTLGTYTAIFNPIKAGTASSLVLTINQSQMVTQPTVTVIPGAIDPDETTAGFTTSNVASGSTDTVTIAVKDAAGNPIPNLAGNLFDLSLSAGSSTGTFEAVTQSSALGTYTAIFNPIKAGTASSLDLVIDDVQIAAQPTVTVTPGSLDRDASTVKFNYSIDPSGVEDTVTIVLLDANGNGIAGLTSGDFNFTLAGGTSTGSFEMQSFDSPPGTYTAEFTGLTSGTSSTLTLYVDNVELASNPPITVTLGALDPGQTTVNFASPTLVAGTTDKLTIAVKDTGGDAISGLTSNEFVFGFTGGTSNGAFGTVSQTPIPGIYTAIFTGIESGSASSLVLNIDGIPIDDEPTVQVNTGTVNGSNSTAAFTTSVVSSGTTDTVTIMVEDVEGNPIANLTKKDFALTFSGGTSTGNLGTVTPGTTPGTYTATFTGAIAGSAKTLKVKVNGISIAAEPKVQVMPGAVSASGTTVSLASTADVAGQTDLLTITAKDAAGNAITGLTSGDFSLALSGPAGTGTATFGTFKTTAKPGVYTYLLTGNAAGTAGSVTVEINGTAIKEEPKVTVKPGPVSAVVSSAEFKISTVSKGSTDLLILVVADAAGNAITGLKGSNVDLIFLGGTSTGTFGPLTSTSTPGTYTIIFIPVLSGTPSTWKVKIDGVALSTQPSVQVM